MINEPLQPEACGFCSACKNSENDPWKCTRPWGVGKLLGPLDRWYDPDTGLKKDKTLSGKSYKVVESDWGQSASAFGSERNVDYKYVKCAHSHKPLVVPLADGTSVTIYGGAAASPVHNDCDVYVELDAYSGGVLCPYPWKEQTGATVIKYPVTDMQAPKDAEDFKKLVKWIVAELLAGKKVHIGCIGGHGRTGTLLAAIVKELTGNVDAIDFVRKNYCHKAVESDTQVKFLANEFGVTERKGYKSSSNGGSKGYTVEKKSTQTDKFNSRYGDLFGGSSKEVTLPVEPIAKKGNIWSA